MPALFTIITTYFQKHSFLQEGDLPPPNSHFSPTIVASRYSESPVSDFEDGYSLYRDRLEQVPRHGVVLSLTVVIVRMVTTIVID
jgi:hypothetical protein